MKNLRKLLCVAALVTHGCATTDGLDVDDGETSPPVDDDGGGGDAKPGKTTDGPTKEHEQALGEQLGLSTIMTLAKEAGLPCENLVMSGAVAMAESEGWVGATNLNGASGDCPNGSTDRGIWQINDCYWPDYDDACAFDPACNAMAMAVISQNGSSFSLWSSVANGSYANYLDEAEEALDFVPGCGDGDPGSEPPKPGGTRDAECDELGYAGTCADDVALWSDDETCWVRDCASEGKTCGLISPTEGYGCVQGPEGSTKEACADLDYEGACYGDVLVWVEGGSCNYVDCASTGRDCIFAGGSIGYDCQ